MKRRYIVLVLAVASLFTSCKTSMYVSNTVNVPLLREQGEVKINIDESNAQIAVAATKHFGVMINGFSKKYQGPEYFKHDGRLAEIGLGYFTPVKNEHIIFEAYGGAGMGTVDKRVTFTNLENVEIVNSFHAKGHKFFVQPSIGYSNRYFDLAFTPRFSYVKYTDFTYSGFTQEELMKDYLDNEKLTKSYFTFAEPAVTLRLGFRYVKLQLQYGATMKLGNQEIKTPSQFGSIGVVADIARWHKIKGK